MTEKYKIYIPEDMKSRLMDDAELFEFFKKDGTINLNAFLKELLVNYFSEYRRKKEELLDTILADLSGFPSIPRGDAEAIADRIINTYMKTDQYRAGRNAAVTLTVSGRSYEVMKAIENNLLADIPLSQYINGLFRSYLSIARSRREMIIFRDTFEELNEAVRGNRIVTFATSSSGSLAFTVYPYVIVASREEQCNYLLCTDAGHQAHTYRISRITALYTASDSFVPDEEDRRKLLEIARRNPQSASKCINATVMLTERGIHKFRMIVKNRPDVIKREGNTYYFNWPKSPLEDYFRRFGYDALIVSPDECRESMKSFYERSLEAYMKSHP
ncbi:MAG: WYL domain-containing protein [Lachnospiraceae bacterium]|nr:WYL domain-containing protein [Lachnospiraceae bacterium]